MKETGDKEGHRKRLRERFIKDGLGGFLDYEVVELLLTLGQPRKDMRKQAKEAIKLFKNFAGVLDAPPEELQKIKGIGKINSFCLKLVKEAADLYLKQTIIKKDALKSSSDVFRYLIHSMRGLDREVFKVLFLDAQNRIIEIEDIFSGSLTSNAIYPREIIKKAIKYKAAGLIFCHNHPSGNINPSEDDRRITKQLFEAGRIMQIRVLDHIIIGANNYYSFADNGEL